ncbi:MAG: Ig-like domain-containing protein [Terriglobales bacterium]
MLALVALLVGCGGSSTGTLAVIVISPTTSFLGINAQETFTATAQDSKGKSLSGVTFTWTSNAPDIASIDTAGVVTGHTVGTVQITASSSGVTSAAANLNVISATTAVASVSLTPISSTIKVGQTQQFTANAVDASGNTVSGVTLTWHNSSAGVAIVGTNGLATGIAPGVTVINASVGTVSSPAATLTVTAP